MEMWDSVQVKNFIVPVLHLKIGLGKDVLNNLLDFIESDVKKLSTGEEVDHNKMVTLNQGIAKRQQNRKIWDVHDGIILRRKAMHIKRLQATKYSTPGLNDDLVITISLSENFVKKKKEEREELAEEISQLLTERCTLTKKMKYYRRYRQ